MAAHASGSRRASHPCALMVIKLSRFARIMGVHRRDDWRKQDASNLTGAAPTGAALSLAGTHAARHGRIGSADMTDRHDAGWPVCVGATQVATPGTCKHHSTTPPLQNGADTQRVAGGFIERKHHGKSAVASARPANPPQTLRDHRSLLQRGPYQQRFDGHHSPDNSGHPAGKCMRSRPGSQAISKRVASSGSPSRFSTSGCSATIRKRVSRARTEA